VSLCLLGDKTLSVRRKKVHLSESGAPPLWIKTKRKLSHEKVTRSRGGEGNGWSRKKRWTKVEKSGKVDKKETHSNLL